jgi:hypothetical protein
VIQVVTLSHAGHALGSALHYVARREPFASFRAADLVATVSGEIDRGHYRFAVDGPRVLGYLGWALYDADVAARCAAGGHPPPPPRLANGADVLWVLTAVSSSPAAFIALVKTVRRAHPQLRWMGVRHKPGGRFVFDRQPLHLSELDLSAFGEPA